MNFQEFLKYKEETLKKNTSIINLAENNLYDYFRNEFPISSEVTSGHIGDKVYRCHMIEDYLREYKLPENLKEFSGASLGVRSSLSILFPALANWVIPSDVYPFYETEISKNQKPFSFYSTLGANNLFSNIPDGTLLVVYPLKPSGREYTKDEIYNLHEYLERNPANRIVVDMVYWLNFGYPEEILDLYLSNQVILLHSFSKQFLIPNCFGVSLLPNNTEGKRLRELYKSAPKDETKLNQAFNALKENRNVPAEIKERLRINRIVVETILNRSLPSENYNPGYLFYFRDSPSTFLEKGILVIPESVFGGKFGGSVVSVLIK